jgi:hypothetical protein
MSVSGDAIYDVLVREAGATDDESNRAQFHYFWEDRASYREYRFMGTLGFGGKFWVSPEGFYVNCYPENLTDDRAETIRRTNKALKRLSNSPKDTE